MTDNLFPFHESSHDYGISGIFLLVRVFLAEDDDAYKHKEV